MPKHIKNMHRSGAVQHVVLQPLSSDQQRQLATWGNALAQARDGMLSADQQRLQRMLTNVQLAWRQGNDATALSTEITSLLEYQNPPPPPQPSPITVKSPTLFAVSAPVAVVRSSLASQTTPHLVETLMGYLANGRESRTGNVSGDQMDGFERMRDALAYGVPSGIVETLWNDVVTKCVRKWVLVHSVDGRVVTEFGSEELIQLREAFAAKLRGILALKFNQSILLNAIHRHSVEVLQELQSYDVMIVSKAVVDIHPLQKAESIQAACNEARAVATAHSNPNIKKNAGTIVSSAARQGIQGVEAGRRFALSIIVAYESARSVAAANSNPDIQKNAATIANAVANKAIQGMDAGRVYAELVIEAYEAARTLADAHTDLGVRNNAATIANLVALKGIRGNKAGRAFSELVIAGYLAARSAAAEHPNPDIQKNAATIANAAVHKKAQGTEAGKMHAASIIEAYEAARAIAVAHSSVDIQRNAATIASATAHRAIQGAEVGKAFALSLIEAYEGARAVVAAHSNPDIQNNAGTIAQSAAHRGVQGVAAGKAFAASVIAVCEGARAIAAAHSNSDIQRNAGTIAAAVAMRGLKGVSAGRAFAISVIAAYEEVRAIAEAHPSSAIRKTAASIANIAALKGIQGAEAGRVFAQQYIAERLKLPPQGERGFATPNTLINVLTLGGFSLAESIPQPVRTWVGNTALGGISFLFSDIASDLLLKRRQSLTHLTIPKMVENYAALTVGGEVVGRPIAEFVTSRLGVGLARTIFGNMIPLSGALLTQEFYQTGHINWGALPGRMSRIGVASGSVSVAVHLTRLASFASRRTLLGALILGVADFTVLKVFEDSNAIASEFTTQQSLAEAIAELVDVTHQALMLRNVGKRVAQEDLVTLKRELDSALQVLAVRARHPQPEGTPVLSEKFTPLPMNSDADVLTDTISEDDEKANVDMNGNPMRNPTQLRLAALVARNPRAQLIQFREFRQNAYEALGLSEIASSRVEKQNPPSDYVQLPQPLIPTMLP